MGLFKRKLQQRALAIDTQRWSNVMHLLEQGERPIENTPAKFHFIEGIENGFVYLTDRAVIFLLPDSNGVKRVLLHEITVVDATGPSSFYIGRLADGQPERTDVEMYPSPISRRLYAELIDRVRAIGE